MELRKLTRDDVQIGVTTEAEEAPLGLERALEDAFPDTDEPEQDRAMRAELAARVRAGDEWAFCSVTVKVSWNDREAEASLGHCSYAGEEEFRKESGYFDDMVDEALDELNRELAEAFEELRPLVLEGP